MPTKINGQLLFSTTETCESVGISRATLTRWLQRGILKSIRRDRRGFKLFTEEDLQILKAEAQKINIEELN